MLTDLPLPLCLFVMPRLYQTPTGVIITKADNDNINTVDDLKDKVIGALAISDFAGAQVQFYVMHEAGLDYIVDPKQVIFTGEVIRRDKTNLSVVVV